MPHEVDASGNPILRHGRPSPRTGTTGAGIQKFGTQQLKYFDSATLGVIEKDIGARTRLTFGGEATTPATPFSARYQEQRPATIRTEAQLETSPHAIPLLPDLGDIKLPDLGDLFGNGNGNGNGKKCTKCDSDKCVECDAWDVPCELGHMFAGTCTPPPVDYTKNGCECENCKNGTGECSDKCGKCNAWDLGCEATCGFTPPPNTWLWVKIILVLIGIGILLWLLRPLFGIAKNITET